MDNRAIHGASIDVTVEDIHEHADADHVAVVKAEFRRRRGLSDKIDDAVRRAYDEPLTHRRVTVGITKEVDTPNRQDQTRPAERGPNDKKYKRRDTEYADKSETLLMKTRNDDRERVHVTFNAYETELLGGQLSE